MVEFVAFISLIAGILQIILFFKVWGMTNDIRTLKIDYFDGAQLKTKEETANYLRKNLLLGNMDKVKNILLQNFIKEIEQVFSEMKTGDYKRDENGSYKWVSFEEENKNKSIEPYIENLKRQFAKIGEEVPVFISQLKTFGDYYKLFVKADLTVNEDNGK